MKFVLHLIALLLQGRSPGDPIVPSGAQLFCGCPQGASSRLGTVLWTQSVRGKWRNYTDSSSFEELNERNISPGKPNDFCCPWWSRSQVLVFATYGMLKRLLISNEKVAFNHFEAAPRRSPSISICVRSVHLSHFNTYVL